MDQGVPGWLVFFAIVVGIYLLIRGNTWKDRARRIANVDQAEAALRQEKIGFDSNKAKFELVLADQSRVYPWAAKIYGDLLAAEADHLINMLKTKRRPAFAAAKEVQHFKREMRERLQACKYAEYKAHIYESVFPHLIDLVEGAPTTDLAVAELDSTAQEDPIRRFLSEGEYTKLSPAERSDKALERYLARRKSNWEIGRDYERFVGFEYEREGWDVQFHGATKGLEDLGRDLIAKKPGQTSIIQCKYWAQWKDIHENAIFQLFGSVVDYLFENGLMNRDSLGERGDVFSVLKDRGVSGVFVTSTTLSKRAAVACEALQIGVVASKPLGRYPMIKCNVGRDGEKLYHLPMDQQYDRVKIEPRKGEFYSLTAAEAEEKGFRRAFRWRPGATQG